MYEVYRSSQVCLTHPFRQPEKARFSVWLILFSTAISSNVQYLGSDPEPTTSVPLVVSIDRVAECQMQAQGYAYAYAVCLGVDISLDDRSTNLGLPPLIAIDPKS